ncbi:MAG: AraC family transcriptional regulator [Clostridia bacterium]|nr:AraC family transcriptional regulator [Clostridia bacterium]
MQEAFIFEDRKFKDINPIHVGHEACAPKHSFGPAIRINYLIHYVLSGEGVLYAPNGEFKVKEGQLFLIKPGEINTYTADEKKPWDYIWIEFNGEVANKLSHIDNPVIECDRNIFTNLWNLRTKKEFAEEYAASYIFSLIPVLLGKDVEKDISGRIVNYIHSNYMRNISVEELSKSMGYSRQHISRVFKNDIGCPIQQYLIKTRLSNAKTLLSKGFTVYETAFMCGYNDSFNFSKSFKEEYKISPKQWQSKKDVN